MLTGVANSIISLEYKSTPNLSFNRICRFIADNEVPPNATKSSSIKTASRCKTSLNAFTTTFITSSPILVSTLFSLSENLSILPLGFNGISFSSTKSEGSIYWGNSTFSFSLTVSISNLSLTV